MISGFFKRRTIAHTQVAEQSKDFGAGSQTDLTGSLVSSVSRHSLSRAIHSLVKIIKTLCTAAPPPPPSRLRFVWGEGAAIYFLLREVYLFQVVCGSCSESTAPLAYLNYTEARVCDKCYDLLLKGGLPFFGVRNFIFDEIRNLLCLSLNKHYKYTIEANPRRILSSLTLQSYGRN